MSTTRLVFYVSDGTGITAETIGHSLLTQFGGMQFNTSRIPFVDSVERALEVRERARFMDARVDQDDPVAGGQRPGVSMGDTRPGKRQAQAPDAGQHPLTPAHHLLASTLCHEGQLKRRPPAGRCAVA